MFPSRIIRQSHTLSAYRQAVEALGPTVFWPISELTEDGGDYRDTVNHRLLTPLNGVTKIPELVDNGGDALRINSSNETLAYIGPQFSTGDYTAMVWLRRTGTWVNNRPAMAGRDTANSRHNFLVTNFSATSVNHLKVTVQGLPTTTYTMSTVDEEVLLNEVYMVVLRWTNATQTVEFDLFNKSTGHVVDASEVAGISVAFANRLQYGYYATGDGFSSNNSDFDSPAYFEKRLTDEEMESLYLAGGGFNAAAIAESYAIGDPRSGIQISDPRMLHPALLIPGRKPTVPVKVDWTHPLTRGMFLAYVPQNSFSAVRPGGVEQAAITGSPALAPYGGIMAARYADNNINAGEDAWFTDFSGENLSGADGFSCMALHRPYDDNYYSVKPQYIASNRNSSNTGLSYYINGGTSGTPVNPGKPSFVIQGVAAYQSTGYLLSHANGYVVHGCTAANNGRLDMYVGAESIYNTTIGAFTSSTDDWRIGGAGSSGGNPLDGYVGFVYLWSRKLTDVEWRQLHANPYQFLIPR